MPHAVGVNVALDAVDHGRGGGGGGVDATPSKVAPRPAVHRRDVAALLVVRGLPAAPVPLPAAGEPLLDVQPQQAVPPVDPVLVRVELP